MDCPKCGAARTAEEVTCARCGVVFHKYDGYLRRLADYNASKRAPGRLRRFGSWLLGGAAGLAVPPGAMRTYWWAYAVLWAALAAWGLSWITQDIDALGRDAGFMHMVNLPFHEAGHVFFGVFGDWVGSLGGTLGQLLMPAIAGGALLWQRADTFGASVCLWWLGQSLLDIAPYMADARAGVLPLLGGNTGRASPYGFHDWEFILGELGLLAYDTALAAFTLNLGRLVMLAALAWGGYLLLRARGGAV